MKKFIVSIFLVLITNSAIAGSCPMLWGKIDAKTALLTDSDFKNKVIELRDAGEKAHSDGDHSKSEKLLKEALSLLDS